MVRFEEEAPSTDWSSLPQPSVGLRQRGKILYHRFVYFRGRTRRVGTWVAGGLVVLVDGIGFLFDFHSCDKKKDELSARDQRHPKYAYFTK